MACFFFFYFFFFFSIFDLLQLDNLTTRGDQVVFDYEKKKMPVVMHLLLGVTGRSMYFLLLGVAWLMYKLCPKVIQSPKNWSGVGRNCYWEILQVTGKVIFDNTSVNCVDSV